MISHILEDHIKANLENINFDFNSAKIQSNSISSLKEILKYIKKIYIYIYIRKKKNYGFLIKTKILDLSL